MKIDIKLYFSIIKYNEAVHFIKNCVPFEFNCNIGNAKFTLNGRKCDNGLWENDYVVGINCNNKTSGQGHGENKSEFLKNVPNYNSFIDYLKKLIAKYDETIIFEEDKQLSMFDEV